MEDPLVLMKDRRDGDGEMEPSEVVAIEFRW